MKNPIKWLKTLFVTRDLNKLVIIEATALKKMALKDELDRLDFGTMDPESKS